MKTEIKTEIKTVIKTVLKTDHKIIYSYYKKMSFIKVKDPRKREELIRDFIETRKRIKDNFIAKKVGEAEYQTGLTKLFKPVTETQKTTTEKITQELLPIKEGIEKLPGFIKEAGQSLSEGFPALGMTEEELIKIGPIARKYIQSNLGRATTKAGLYSEDDNLKIGYRPVKIENDDIIIDDTPFKGTVGLWKLITSKDIPDKTEYSAEDLADYITIMHITKATYDKNNKRVGGNDKMNKLIKPLVKALEKDGGEGLIDKIEEHFGFGDETGEEEYEDAPFTPTKGTGLPKILPSDPNALIDRFDLLFSSQKAGHTGVRNEIVSILDELKRQGVLKTNEYKKLNSLIKK